MSESTLPNDTFEQATATSSGARDDRVVRKLRADQDVSAGAPPPMELESVISLMKAVGDEMHATIDTSELRRSLDMDSASMQLKDDPNAVLQAILSRSTATAQMRIDFLSLSALEAASYVRPRAPIGRCWMGTSGQLEWFLITYHRGRKYQVVDSRSVQKQSLTAKEIAAKYGDSGSTVLSWVAFQPILADGDLHHEHGSSASLWSKYLSLLAPERSDITVIVIFAAVASLLMLSTPIAVEALVNTVAFGQLLQPVVILAIMLFVFLAFAATLRGLQIYVAELIQQRLFVRIAGGLAARLPRVKYEFWSTHYGPELINRFFEVVTLQKVTTQLLLDGTTLVLQMLVGMAVIAFYHPILLGFNVVLLTLITVIIFVLGRKAVTTSIQESREKYATAAWLEELARHPFAFRSSGGTVFAAERTDRLLTSYLLARNSHFRILIRQTAAALTLQVFASTALLGLGGWLVIRGELTLGQLVAAELIVTVIVGSLAKIAKYLEGFYDVMASVDKLSHLFEMPLNHADGTALARISAGIAVTAHELSLSANAGKDLRLNFQAASGEWIAVVGGKANLRRAFIETLAGLRPAACGHVDLDGTDIRRLRLDTVQDQVAVVCVPEVFAGSIAENIHLGRAHVRESDIRTALADVGLLDHVLDLPEGLDTVLPTDGKLLSDDLLTRLMLARALAAQPRLLLIDGALDLLPAEELQVLLDRLRKRLSKCTCIFATSRQAVKSHCRRQIVIDTGSTQ